MLQNSPLKMYAKYRFFLGKFSSSCQEKYCSGMEESVFDEANSQAFFPINFLYSNFRRQL